MGTRKDNPPRRDMNLDPTVLGITADEAPKEQPQEVAPAKEEAVVEAPKEQPQLPEKFKSVEDMVRSYEHAESELTRQRQINREMERRIGDFQSSQQAPTEEEVFKKEWEIDPQVAVSNRTQRAEARIQNQLSAANANMFYKNAMNDDKNYPGFKDLEPKMIEIANAYAPLVDQRMINSPQVIDLIYKLARADSVGDMVGKAKIIGEKQAESRRREVNAATMESPTPASASVTRPEDMTLEQLEKQIGFVQR